MGQCQHCILLDKQPTCRRRLAHGGELSRRALRCSNGPDRKGGSRILRIIQEPDTCKDISTFCSTAWIPPGEEDLLKTSYPLNVPKLLLFFFVPPPAADPNSTTHLEKLGPGGNPILHISPVSSSLSLPNLAQPKKHEGKKKGKTKHTSAPHRPAIEAIPIEVIPIYIVLPKRVDRTTNLADISSISPDAELTRAQLQPLLSGVVVACVPFSAIVGSLRIGEAEGEVASVHVAQGAIGAKVVLLGGGC